ncbi:MAG: rhodanese-like domain-containing protein [Pirellulales bacterium]
MVQTILAQAFAELLRGNDTVTLIDVRTPAEFEEVHVDGAQNIPLDQINPEIIRSTYPDTSETLYFICRSGGRSKQACEKMLACGIANVMSIEGGTAGCEFAGVPVQRGRRTISLDRQVRIITGLLVAVGAALSAFGPNAMWRLIGAGLAGFVGCGLAFAGMTDTCGLALCLSKMPWNRRSSAACSTVLLLSLVAGSVPYDLHAEHTQDSLEHIKKNIAEKKAILIDVREPQEWNKGHLTDAQLLSLSSLERGMSLENLSRILPRSKIIYCHCLSGGRCLLAASILEQRGYDARAIKLSYSALVAAGFESTKTP